MGSIGHPHAIQTPRHSSLLSTFRPLPKTSPCRRSLPISRLRSLLVGQPITFHTRPSPAYPNPSFDFTETKPIYLPLFSRSVLDEDCFHRVRRSTMRVLSSPGSRNVATAWLCPEALKNLGRRRPPDVVVSECHPHCLISLVVFVASHPDLEHVVQCLLA